MFLMRFNRNNDKLIQRDEFSDAIFPSGYLLSQDSKSNTREDFNKFIKNQNQELDTYLGKAQIGIIALNIKADPDDSEIAFNPDDHRFSVKRGQKLDSKI